MYAAPSSYASPRGGGPCDGSLPPHSAWFAACSLPWRQSCRSRQQPRPIPMPNSKTASSGNFPSTLKFPSNACSCIPCLARFCPCALVFSEQARQLSLAVHGLSAFEAQTCKEPLTCRVYTNSVGNLSYIRTHATIRFPYANSGAFALLYRPSA